MMTEKQIEKMEIKEENIFSAYNSADENGKAVKQADNRPVTGCIKTFEDACNELGEDHPFVKAYNGYAINIHEDNKNDTDILAYLKLRIIVAALNEGWEPEFSKKEKRFVPWHILWTRDELSQKSEEWKSDRHLMMIGETYRTEFAGFASANSANVSSAETAYFDSRLCLRTDTLATYCGKQFMSLWADFYLIRK